MTRDSIQILYAILRPWPEVLDKYESENIVCLLYYCPKQMTFLLENVKSTDGMAQNKMFESIMEYWLIDTWHMARS